MSVNLEKRVKKFDNEFSYLKSHPSFNDIKILYANGEIKTTSQAMAQFKKIKVTKDGAIKSQSSNQVKKFENKKEESANVQQSRKRKLFRETIEEEMLDSWVHAYDINKMIKKFPKDYFLHVVKFYENNKLSNDYETISFEFNKLNKKQVENKLQFYALNGSDLNWIVREFLEEKVNGKYLNRYVKIETYAFTKQDDFDKQKRLIQIFRSNETNTCVYDGFLQYFNTQCKMRKTIYNKLVKNKERFAKSYTRDEIKEIAEFCKCSVVIKDLINNDDEIINSNVLNRYTITFINTKYNHLDLYTCTTNEAEVVDASTYEEIKNSSNYYLESNGKLFTLDKIYKLADTEFKIIFDKWKLTNNFSKLSISSDSLAYGFLDSYDFNMHRFFNDLSIVNDLYTEIDLKKAYYNYSNLDFNSHYIGVPSGSFYCVQVENNFGMKEFNKIYKNKLIGFFSVRITKSNDKLAFYGFSIGSIHTLTSATIKFLSSYCEFEFISCMYAPSVHIPFTKEFLNVGEDKIKYYCKAYGQFMCDSSMYSIEIKPLDNDKEFYQTLKEDRNIRESNGVYKIYGDNGHFNSWRHIAYFIHSYTTTLILEQLLKYDCSDVFGVKLDSIVLKKNIPLQLTNSFDTKEANIEKLLKYNKKVDTNGLDDNLDDGEFIEMYTSSIWSKYKQEKISSIKFDKSFCPTGEILLNRLVFLGGAGGSGKTYGTLSSGCFNNKNICFTSKCWNLIQEQKKQFPKIIGLSFPKITGQMDGFKVEKYTGSNIRYVFIDEATLADEKDIKTIIKDYSNCWIIVAGDIDIDGTYYQCSCLNKVIKPKSMGFQYITYTKTYRFDDELNGLLMGLRKLMASNCDNIKLLKYVRKNFFKCFIDKDLINFNDDDIGISAKRNKTDNGECLLSNYFIERGAKPQYVIKNTVLEKNQLRGQIYYEKPTHNNYRMTLFRTIHSFQGCQLHHENKIIIYLDSLFDRNLLYTALSRARRVDQIQIYY